MSSSSVVVPKMGPDPVLLSRKEVDALYETFVAVKTALEKLKVDYIVTGGSLLGAIRQHSILFCDDDIDIAIIERKNNDNNDSIYQYVSTNLQDLLGEEYTYQIRPWEGGDRVRPKRVNTVFLDLFCLRRYDTMNDLKQVIGIKKNGQAQSESYVHEIMNTMTSSAHSQGETAPLCPFWHFDTRKAVEMWPKEVYRDHELFPLSTNLKFGPYDSVKGPRAPIWLLQRAFGMDCFDVYYQSAPHNQPIETTTKSSTNQPTSSSNNTDNKKDLPPLVAPGGAWEGGKKVPLENKHYIPMQPTTRAARRPTLHNREQLHHYLIEASKQEEAWLLGLGNDKDTPNSNLESQPKDKGCFNSNKPQREEEEQQKSRPPQRTVYMDGVFDLFHLGHLQAIQQCAALGNRVVIGVTGDADAAGYKRPPIVPEQERSAIIAALRDVDEVVCPCPLVVTEEFMKAHHIDLVVHGFANDADAQRQRDFFEIPAQEGKFQTIPYYRGLSTTDRIRNICESFGREEDEKNDKDTTPILPMQPNVDNNGSHKPQWFGSALARATHNAPTIPYDPFPVLLRQTIEPHIRKATKRRQEALAAIRQATGPLTYDQVLAEFHDSGMAQERDFEFDPGAHALLPAFLQSAGLPTSCDLSRLHHENPQAKDMLLYTLAQQPIHFQYAFDNFVRKVCVPHMSTIYNCDEAYYQAIPCIRVVQPNEFSIGPHADVAYGHHPCSVNFYVPLTPIGGTSALFLESRLGAEDWHPIVGDIGLGRVKHFAGAICTHWTTENKTSHTRVSIDFRLIPGPLFHALADGGSVKGGQLDVYRLKKGYYSRCHKIQASDGTASWEREGPLLAPDARIGFPWTVKNWDTFWQKKEHDNGEVIKNRRYHR